jgi:hypothetical protein
MTRIAKTLEAGLEYGQKALEVRTRLVQNGVAEVPSGRQPDQLPSEELERILSRASGAFRT